MFPHPPTPPQTGTPVPAATGGRPRGDGGVPAATASPSHGVPPTAGQRMWSPIPPHPRRATAFPPPPLALATASPPWQPHLRGNRVSPSGNRPHGNPFRCHGNRANRTLAVATQPGDGRRTTRLINRCSRGDPVATAMATGGYLLPWRWPSLRQPGVPVAVAMARDGLDVAGGEWEVLGGGPDTPFTSLDLSPPLQSCR